MSKYDADGGYIGCLLFLIVPIILIGGFILSNAFPVIIVIGIIWLLSSGTKK